MNVSIGIWRYPYEKRVTIFRLKSSGTKFEKFSIGLQPKLLQIIRQHKDIIVVIFGVRLHQKRRY